MYMSNMLCVLVSQIDININALTSKMFIAGKRLVFIYELLQSNLGMVSLNTLMRVASWLHSLFGKIHHFSVVPVQL